MRMGSLGGVSGIVVMCWGESGWDWGMAADMIMFCRGNNFAVRYGGSHFKELCIRQPCMRE